MGVLNFGIIIGLTAGLVLGQAPAPAPAPVPASTVAPGAAATPTPPQTPAPPAEPARLEYAGKPLAVPFACTEETLQTVGLSCPESEPCPIFVELAALDATGGRLVMTGNIHSSSTTFSSLMLMSEDGGKTWTEPVDRMPQTVLEGVQFVDAMTGWAGGQLLTTLPRDPFFLVTTDGAKTWRKRPVSDESRVAAVDSFYFESRTDGGMVLDRTRGGMPNAKYELYETKTGGDTWMLREVTGKPLKLRKTAPPVLPEFRLRADAPSKSYRVERRQGQRWTTLASFLVRLPDCQIADKELAPPPEPPADPDAAKSTIVVPSDPSRAPGAPRAAPSRSAPAPRKKQP
ncbi:MAG: hypothetical protein NTV70_14465 [Acidobacteria bacterium]|nr:hypothetical protein [Acidobacteriota bacterium]